MVCRVSILANTMNFWQKIHQSSRQTVTATKYRYLSYFFGIPIGLTICVNALACSLIPPEISSFAWNPEFPGIQERYVSAAG
jgi:hypothetical protein